MSSGFKSSNQASPAPSPSLEGAAERRLLASKLGADAGTLSTPSGRAITLLERLLAHPPAPEYTRLLAMMDFDRLVYAAWISDNIDRISQGMEDEKVSNEDADCWLSALFIYEQWQPR